ncbi:PASTA domain-containing protein [Streptomyces wuyuanensis]|uniref:PASTA domain-containing protein n=1 Tax=Streptomyces wuyuanensis TaxID=1196353 RepID=UPI003712901A
MRRPNRAAAAILLACLAAGTTACNSSNGDGKAAPSSAPATPAASSPAPTPSDTRSEAQKAQDTIFLRNEKNQEQLTRDIAAAAANNPGAGQTAELPSLVGMTVAGAQDVAEVFGFQHFVDEDATGLDRPQVLEQQWRVCSQDPSPGTQPLEALVTLHAVRHDEECP